MALVLNSEAQLVRDSALEFFADKSPILMLRKLRDSKDPDGFSRPLWREMADLGWTGFLVPEAHGGSEFGMVGLGQVLEAAGRTLAATPLLSTALIAASAIDLAGSVPIGLWLLVGFKVRRRHLGAGLADQLPLCDAQRHAQPVGLSLPLKHPPCFAVLEQQHFIYCHDGAVYSHRLALNGGLAVFVLDRFGLPVGDKVRRRHVGGRHGV